MEFVTSFFDLFVEMIKSLPSLIVGAIDFIALIFFKLPLIITTDFFSELPFIFRYGLLGCFGVVIAISSFKLLKILKY